MKLSSCFYLFSPASKVLSSSTCFNLDYLDSLPVCLEMDFTVISVGVDWFMP